MSFPNPVCLVRGSINIDEFYHVRQIVKPGQTISAEKQTKRLGGKGANQAKAAASAGVRVILDGAVGDDEEGKLVKQQLCSAIEGSQGKILDEKIRLAEGYTTGKAIIQLAEDGENSIIILAGANYSPWPSSQSSISLLPSGATHLLLANEIPFSSTTSYLSAAHRAHVIPIWNPSPMPSQQQLQGFPWSDMQGGWLIINEGELEEIVRALCDNKRDSNPVPESVASFSDSVKTAHDHGHELFNKLAKTVNLIITLGSHGVLWIKRLSPLSAEVEKVKMSCKILPAAQLLNPIKDTTGAGDCFTGYFAAGLMQMQQMQLNEEEEAEEFEKVVSRCLTACAICVEREGAQDSYASISEVEQRMRESGRF